MEFLVRSENRLPPDTPPLLATSPARQRTPCAVIVTLTVVCDKG